MSREAVSLRGQDYIATLSSGDLRGTNPANPADRHIAVMLEALRSRQVLAQATNTRTARRKARAQPWKTAATAKAKPRQATASPS